jgi:AraC-like DNA-binding protein
MKKFALRVLIISLPLLLFLIAFFTYKPHQVYSVLPVKDSISYHVYTYSDTVKNPLDYSTASLISVQKDSITFRYKLDSSEKSPFAGITLLPKTKKIFSIKKYDFFEIELYARYAKRPQILLGLTSDTSVDNRTIEKYIIKDLDLIRGQNIYKIPLEDFTTPSWWYINEGVSEKDIADISFSDLRLINIQNCQLIRNNLEDEITIKEIHFTKNTRWFYMLAILLAVAYYFIFYFLLLVRLPSKSQREKIEIHYTPVQMVNYSGLYLDKLVAHLSSHYDQPDLSLKSIQEAIGLSETKVSMLLKNAFQLTFKQYLNKLRITEAKRLLKDVNVPVSDIAYKVGYGHISHFNRVFKELEGMSPNDYRKTIIL